MGVSQQRSRLGVGVAKWEEEQSWYFSNADDTFIICDNQAKQKFIANT